MWWGIRIGRDEYVRELQSLQEAKSDLLVLAEAEVPQAMAEAFRTGKLGIMDYYKLRNVQADTDMRKSIAGTGTVGTSGAAVQAAKSAG